MLRIGSATDVLTLDLPSYVSSQDLLVGGLILEDLVGYDKDMKFVPLLAESWTQPDSSTYVFNIRQGVTFTDGSPLNAAAVKGSIDRARKDQRQSHYLDMIASIDATSEFVVTFHLTKPYAPFMHFLTLGVAAIEAPASLGPTDVMARKPVGTGPFELKSWPGSTITLERNPHYWGTQPLLDGVEFRFIADESAREAALEAGEVDVIQNVPPADFAALKATSGLHGILNPYAQTFWLGFTRGSSPILDNLQVRKAIAMAIDRATIVQTVTEGMMREATGGFLPPELGIQPSTEIPYDVNGAKQLLAQAGYPNGFEITLTTPIGRYVKDVEISQVIQAELANIGIKVTINSLQYAGYAAMMKLHQAEMFVLGWIMQGSPDVYQRAVVDPASNSNWSNFNDPTVTSKMDQAAAEGSLDQANQLFHQIDQQMVDDVFGVPIYHSNSLIGASAKVHELVVDPFGDFILESTWIGN